MQRLGWKTDLIARLEDRLIQPPLPLPPRIDPDAVSDFDYRRVYATGVLNHRKEMLVGPRLNDGEDGFLVVTPLERAGEDGQQQTASILVNRGWIPKDKKMQRDRDPAALPRGEITVQGLLRQPWKKNSFTPDNKPAQGVWYFPDVSEMAEWAGTQPVWIEETMSMSNPLVLAKYLGNRRKHSCRNWQYLRLKADLNSLNRAGPYRVYGPRSQGHSSRSSTGSQSSQQPHAIHFHLVRIRPLLTFITLPYTFPRVSCANNKQDQQTN